MERGGAVASAERKPGRGICSRESVMLEVMETDEVHAGGLACTRVLIQVDEGLYGKIRGSRR